MEQSGILRHGAKWHRDGHVVVVEGTCMFSNQPWKCKVNGNEFDRWLNGELIQNAMPGVSTEVKEMLISGMGPSIQESIFNNIPPEDYE